MSQEFYKKIYSHSEFYKSLYEAVRSIRHLAWARRKELLSQSAIERIMLAVTEVNGCEVCSYAHTKMALEKGMSAKEISDLLSGNADSVPEDEAIAVFFAQHYADRRGNPTEESWQRLIDQYGDAASKGILDAARIMTAANIHGIALSAMARRLKGSPVSKTGLIYEVSIILSIIAYLPAAVILAVLADLRKVPLLNFRSPQ
ncbi:MAG: carboxymuconolactone decarboxylase family protein [Youngiibacter sp.]|nr:carboxymuconolactone decarboxylase family protein [Youngiibacter sp.]